MLAKEGKISIRQAIMIFLTTTYTPCIRVMPVYAAQRAEQAAWLSPLVAVAMLILIAYIWQALYSTYNNHTLMDIYSDITGKIVGKILIVVHLIWVIILSALYLRYFAVRLIGSIYPNVGMSIFMVSILLVVVYSLRRGLAAFARLNEVIFLLITISFYILVILMIPNIQSRFLVPITYRHIVPIINGSTGITGILAYFSFIFVFGNNINNKEKIKKFGVQASIFLLIALPIIIITTLGTFSYRVVQRTKLPFLIAVKQISLFDTLEKIESIAVAFWVMSDFVLIGFFMICALSIIKSLFKVSDIKPFFSIYAILICILALVLTNSALEMEKFSEYVALPINILIGFVLPIIVFLIGKVRKKV